MSTNIDSVVKVTLPEKLFLRLTAFKDNNDHGTCYQEAARALGLTSLEMLFTRINHRHAHLGHLRHDLEFQRRAGYTTLLKEAAILLSPIQYKRLYGCF